MVLFSLCTIPVPICLCRWYVKQNLNQKVYNTLIPRNIRLAEAPSYGMPINMYDPKSAGAEAYMQLAEEVIKNK